MRWGANRPPTRIRRLLMHELCTTLLRRQGAFLFPVQMRFSAYLPALGLAALLGMVFPGTAHAQQGKFTINGRLKVDGGSVDGSRVVVYKNGQKDRTLSNGLNK